ncbi:hypothetical protein ACWGR4_36335 [Embleya sp. NPDC055664]|uniref:hypothetical protein n=1 Tax=unclassified Embleya TaxID=2699296 RepID=UPI0036ADFCD3
MSTPLILGRRAELPTEQHRSRLPEHHYDPIACVNVVADGRLLIDAAAPRLIAEYTRTQEPSGLKQDD